MWQRLSPGPWHDLNITVNFHRFNGSGLPAGWQAGFTENQSYKQGQLFDIEALDRQKKSNPEPVNAYI